MAEYNDPGWKPRAATQLRLDAEWWLVESSGHSSRCANSLDVEIWQLRLRNRRQTHRSPKDVQTATQAGSYSRTGTILKVPCSTFSFFLIRQIHPVAI